MASYSFGHPRSSTSGLDIQATKAEAKVAGTPVLGEGEAKVGRMIPKESSSARAPSLLHAPVCGCEPHMVSTSRFTESGCDANPSNGGTSAQRCGDPVTWCMSAREPRLTCYRPPAQPLWEATAAARAQRRRTTATDISVRRKSTTINQLSLFN